MKTKLNVFVNQHKAGELWLDHQRRFCFQYDKNWINSSDSCRLSVSLPLREDPYLNDDSYSYFTNLLPEGNILNVLSRKLQIPVSNQFELLRAIGGIVPVLSRYLKMGLYRQNPKTIHTRLLLTII